MSLEAVISKHPSLPLLLFLYAKAIYLCYQINLVQFLNMLLRHHIFFCSSSNSAQWCTAGSVTSGRLLSLSRSAIACFVLP